jgi:hypothetical protein
MLHEEELLELAHAFRHMAKAELDPSLRLKLTQRAEQYEMVASVVWRRPAESRQAKLTGTRPINWVRI